MRFTKMQGAGNDFVLVETGDINGEWSQRAIDMCDRHYGIGADGLLLLLPSERADCRMRIIDCDGTEAEACGNGLRCLVKYYVDGMLANSETREISVETMTGIRKAKVYKEAGRIIRVQTGMGEPRFSEEDIPVLSGRGAVDIKSMIACPIIVEGQEMSLNLVSMGNPHAVQFLEQAVAEFPLSRIGPEVETLDIFPSRVNFEIARVLNRERIEARVWERGVGETLACGSGACAITVAAQLRGYVDNRVAVKLPGGSLEVEWDGAGEVYLSGPAETVFTGEWPDD